MHLRIIFVISLLYFLGISTMTAQNTVIQEDGVIIQQQWTKSEQSYCAGGSEYYVFKTKEAEYILVTEKAVKLGVKRLLNQKITLKGKLVTKKIKFSPYEQHPVEYDINGKPKDYYECTVLEVEKIGAKKG